jgi:hypothetical protein
VENQASRIAPHKRNIYDVITLTMRRQRASSEKLAGARGLRKAQAQRIATLPMRSSTPFWLSNRREHAQIGSRAIEAVRPAPRGFIAF